MRITDYDRDLDTHVVRECLAGWFRLIETVCDRHPDPDAMARMAILLRVCGRTDASFQLCDRADAVRRVPFTEVVRAGTWRHLGNRAETAAAFRRALALDPANWSLYLDLADLAAEEGDFTEAAALATRGEELEPVELTMRGTPPRTGPARRARPPTCARSPSWHPRCPNPTPGRSSTMPTLAAVGASPRHRVARRASPRSGPGRCSRLRMSCATGSLSADAYAHDLACGPGPRCAVSA